MVSAGCVLVDLDRDMSKNRHTFKLNDAARFMKAAAKAAGLPPERLSYVLNPMTGEITALVRDASAGDGNSTGKASNPWDKVLTNAADQKRPA